MRALIVNFVVFQGVWFSCVLGGAWGWPWVGVAAAGGGAAVHWLQSPLPVREFMLMGIAATIGLVWESSLAFTGVLAYPSGQIVEGFAPVWIVALWVGFATSVNVTLRWLKGRYVVAAVIGGVVGPLTFWSGSRLGAVSFPDPVLAVITLSMGWATLMPTLVWIGGRLDGWPVDPGGIADDVVGGRR